MSGDLLFIALAAFIISNAVLVIAASRFGGLDGLDANTRGRPPTGPHSPRLSPAGLKARSTAVAIELNGSAIGPVPGSITAVGQNAPPVSGPTLPEPARSDPPEGTLSAQSEVEVSGEPAHDGERTVAEPAAGPSSDSLPPGIASGRRAESPAEAPRHRDVVTLSLDQDRAPDGTTVVISAPMNVPPEGELAFRYYLSDQRATVADAAFRAYIERPDGHRSLVFEVLGGSRAVQASWLASRVSLASWASQTIRFVFIVTDGGPDGLVQAAIDDVRLEHPAG